MSALVKSKGAFAKKFAELQNQSVDEQALFFGRRFVFALGDKYSDVFELSKKFKEALVGDDSAKDGSLSAAGAANLLQTTGNVRTAQQRRAELADVDVDGNGMLSFSEFMLLHFKILILTEFYKRNEMEPDVDMGNDGVGLVGVGEKLVQELFDVPQGIDPELEKLMKDFSIEYAKRQAKIAELQAKVDAGGVKGMSAKNELEQLKQQDTTEANAVEARIAAAVKKAVSKSKKELAEKEAQNAKDAENKKAEGRGKLAERAAAFGKRVSQRLVGK